jgi:hypothetical protein
MGFEMRLEAENPYVRRYAHKLMRNQNRLPRLRSVRSVNRGQRPEFRSFGPICLESSCGVGEQGARP